MYVSIDGHDYAGKGQNYRSSGRLGTIPGFHNFCFGTVYGLGSEMGSGLSAVDEGCERFSDGERTGVFTRD